MWANTDLVQSQPGRFDASLGVINCKTDDNNSVLLGFPENPPNSKKEERKVQY